MGSSARPSFECGYSQRFITLYDLVIYRTVRGGQCRVSISSTTLPVYDGTGTTTLAPHESAPLLFPTHSAVAASVPPSRLGVGVTYKA